MAYTVDSYFDELFRAQNPIITVQPIKVDWGDIGEW